MKLSLSTAFVVIMLTKIERILLYWIANPVNPCQLLSRYYSVCMQGLEIEVRSCYDCLYFVKRAYRFGSQVVYLAVIMILRSVNHVGRDYV